MCLLQAELMLMYSLNLSFVLISSVGIILALLNVLTDCRFEYLYCYVNMFKPIQVLVCSQGQTPPPYAFSGRAMLFTLSPDSVPHTTTSNITLMMVYLTWSTKPMVLSAKLMEQLLSSIPKLPHPLIANSGTSTPCPMDTI